MPDEERPRVRPGNQLSVLSPGFDKQQGRLRAAFFLQEYYRAGFFGPASLRAVVVITNRGEVGIHIAGQIHSPVNAYAPVGEIQDAQIDRDVCSSRNSVEAGF